jgi:hypothetical protein
MSAVRRSKSRSSRTPLWVTPRSLRSLSKLENENPQPAIRGQRPQESYPRAKWIAVSYNTYPSCVRGESRGQSKGKGTSVFLTGLPILDNLLRGRPSDIRLLIQENPSNPNNQIPRDRNDGPLTPFPLFQAIILAAHPRVLGDQMPTAFHYASPDSLIPTPRNPPLPNLLPG